MHILLLQKPPLGPPSTRELLTNMGLKVDLVHSLACALEKINTSEFDAVLFESDLTGDSALDGLFKLRSFAPNVPIVIYSTDDDDNKALEAVRSGAQDYLIKGKVSDDSLHRCLQYAIERNRSQLALKRSEERLRMILENSYDAFMSMDSEWRITDWNAQAAQTFGFHRNEIVGKSLSTLIPIHLRTQFTEQIEATFGSAEEAIVYDTREYSALHQEKGEIYIELGIFRIKEDDCYAFCAFAKDITEKRKSKEQLELLVHERTEQLLNSNEELRQFAKVASHDLQEPLKTVEGFAGLLVSSTAGQLNQESTEFLEYIVGAVKRMKDLIQSVLMHSQIACKTVALPTDCNSVVEQVITDMSSSIKETQAIIEVSKLPEVAVERSQLVQLFQNLIGNALKYRGPEAPSVQIRAEQTSNEWLFSVRDNSIGIASEYANQIFDMFARLHPKTRYQGAGIGLAICKRIVNLHGGQIWVESKLGQGSVFLFTLPALPKSELSL